MENKKIIFGIVIGVFVIILLFVFLENKENERNKVLELSQVSKNNRADDDMISFLYERYHPEDQLKFQIAGSDMNGYYGFYFQKKKVTFKDFPSIYKSYILLDLMNYDDHEFDEERNCYLYSLDEYKDAYRKYYGSLDDFSVDTNESYNPRLYLDENTICISKKEDISRSYKKTIDTYMVNAIYQKDDIVIYEKVAFIKMNDQNIEFYKDYNMKNKVYTLKGDQIDRSFINNSNIVSNVLLEYQDQFPLYEYRYVKGDNTYYLESISR